MVLKAYSKVTLSLKVYPKKTNEKKHRIDGVFVLYKKMFDEIDVIPSNNKSDDIKYCFRNKRINIKNCVVKRSLQYLRKQFDIPFYNIKITKKIPLQSGLGGSATDAATIINYVLKSNNISKSLLNIRDIALTLGSDIPYFLTKLNYAQVTEYGDKVFVIRKPVIKFGVVLSNIPINSKDAYEKLASDKRYESKVKQNLTQNLLYKNQYSYNCVYNDLQPYVFSMNSKLTKTKEGLSKNKNKFILSGSGGSFVVLK